MLARLYGDWNVRQGPMLDPVSAPTLKPMSRVLVLNDEGDRRNGFLDAVAELCRTLEAPPVVLTVTRTEEEARELEHAAREWFEARGLAAHYDCVIGDAMPTAVARVARWRHCTHVLVGRQPRLRWWQRLRGSSLHRRFGLPDSLNILSLPRQ
jgi:K+-sensing histidine kinase KdpD